MMKIKVHEFKKQMLLHEAKRWLMTQERGGNNRGQIVEMFQKTIGGAVQEPWCMSFVQFCLHQTDLLIDAMFQQSLRNKHLICRSEHVMTTWNETPEECRISAPQPGAVVCWQYGASSSGHTGIVASVETTGRHIWTIEGNTSPNDEKVEREGDGVFLKKRSIEPIGEMKIKGFLNPWISSENLIILD